MSWLPITDLFSSARMMFSFTSCVDWWFFLRNQDKGNVLRCCQSSDWYWAVFWNVLEYFVQIWRLQGFFFAPRSFLQIISFNYYFFLLFLLNAIPLLLIILSWFYHNLPSPIYALSLLLLPVFLELEALFYHDSLAGQLPIIFISFPN